MNNLEKNGNSSILQWWILALDHCIIIDVDDDDDDDDYEKKMMN